MTTHIYVDVDGVLNACSDHPWDRNPTWDRNRWQSFRAGISHSTREYLIQYNEEVIEALRELEARPDTKMHWLTTWTHDAPANLSPGFGIGADWEVVGGEAKQTYGNGYHEWWKFNELFDHLALTEPDKVVWIDDDLRYYNARVNESRVLKVAPVLEAGLENHHFDAIRAFLET